MKELHKALVCVAIFALFFFVLLGSGFHVGSNDEGEWKHMAQDSSYTVEYKSWLRYPASLFLFNEYSWWGFWVVLFAVITPLLLFKITGNWLAIPFYFCLTNYFYLIIGAGLFAQGLVIIFLLGLIAFKSWYLRLPIFVIGFFSHSTAPFLLGFVFVFLFVQEFVLEYLDKRFWVLGCSPIFGTSKPSVLNSFVGVGQGARWHLTLGDVLGFFVKVCPLPFLWFAFRSWWEQKQFVFFGLLFLSFFFAFLVNSRSLYVVAPLMVIGFTNYFCRLRFQRVWLVLIICFGLISFQQYVWVVLGIGC